MLKRLSLLGLLVLSNTCSDFTGPTHYTAILPAVLDAKVRLTKGILAFPIRQQLTLGISQLEQALERNDPAGAQQVVQRLQQTITNYGFTHSDAADLTAITLMLDAVTREVNNGVI